MTDDEWFEQPTASISPFVIRFYRPVSRRQTLLSPLSRFSDLTGVVSMLILTVRFMGGANEIRCVLASERYSATGRQSSIPSCQ